MSIDTESAGRDACSDSSQGRSRRSSSGKSTRQSEGNSKTGQAGEDGAAAEPKLSSLDVLLSMLQSDLSKILSFGGEVRLYADPNGLIIRLPGVTICQAHKQIHSGEICPHC